MKIDKNRINSICEKIIEYSLYLLAFFLPASKAVVEICATLVFVAWIIKNTNNYSFKLPKTDLNIPILLFILLSILSVTVTSQLPNISAKTFFRKTMEYVIILFVISEAISTRKRLINILIALLVSSFIVGIDGIYQQFARVDFLRGFPRYAGKVTATFQFPNDLAAYLITILPISISLIFHKVTNRRLRFSLISLSIILIICLLLTRTRGAWLGFIFGLFFVSIFNGKKTFFVAILILAILVLFSPHFIKDRIKSFATLSTDVSTEDRMIIWRTGWKMFIDRPFFGHGLGTFMSVFGRYKPQDYSKIVYAHNCYLQIATEMGAFGLFAFLWFIFALLKSAILKLVRYEDKFLRATLSGILGGILAYLVQSFFDTNLYSLPLAVLFWAMAGLAAAKISSK